MKFVQIRIKNYRSITDEISINLGKRTTIVGPNNSGKTNITNAVEAFFSGAINNSYDLLRDLPKGFSGKQTSIIALFSIDEMMDSEFIEIYSEMQDCLEVEKRSDSTFQLFLYYSSAGKPVYQFFPNVKIKNKYSQRFSALHRNAVHRVLNSFSCKSIPSVKDPDRLFSNLLLPFIRRSVALVLDPYLPDIRKTLDKISDTVNSALKVGKLENIRAAFDISGSIEKTLSSFDFQIDDGIRMSASSKGAGLQAATILASLKWIGLEEKRHGRETIWLLEEPESYLHPELAKSCEAIVDDLSNVNNVIITTHAVSFIGQNPTYIYETSIAPNGTTLTQHRTYSEATASIRKALGLRFSDFFQLGRANLLVEGVSDREILTWALQQIMPNRGKNEFPVLRKATIMDFTGVSTLKDFLKHSYEFIRSEVATFIVFDGDDAGVDATNALNGFFSKKSIPFTSNKDYAVLPKGFAIEGLFPKDFIFEIYENHPNWFMNFNVDMEGTLLAFTVKSGNKSSMQRALMRRAEEESKKEGNYFWAKDFIKLFQLAEAQLALKLNQL